MNADLNIVFKEMQLTNEDFDDGHGNETQNNKEQLC